MDSVNHYQGWREWDSDLWRFLDVVNPFHFHVNPGVKNIRNDEWLPRHVLSKLRETELNTPLKLSRLEFKQHKLVEILVRYFRYSLKPKNILAYAEPLVAWRISHVDKKLARIEKKSQEEIFYRTIILRRALVGVTGYPDWV
ncbi:MAG: hypothetical protein AB1531_11830 [Chloroflexota bacterium]